MPKAGVEAAKEQIKTHPIKPQIPETEVLPRSA
jgi:hypothetical protein